MELNMIPKLIIKKIDSADMDNCGAGNRQQLRVAMSGLGRILNSKPYFFKSDLAKSIRIFTEPAAGIQDFYAGKLSVRTIISGNSFSEVFGGYSSFFKSDIESINFRVICDSHICMASIASGSLAPRKRSCSFACSLNLIGLEVFCTVLIYHALA